MALITLRQLLDPLPKIITGSAFNINNLEQIRAIVGKQMI